MRPSRTQGDRKPGGGPPRGHAGQAAHCPAPRRAADREKGPQETAAPARLGHPGAGARGPRGRAGGAPCVGLGTEVRPPRQQHQGGTATGLAEPRWASPSPASRITACWAGPLNGAAPPLWAGRGWTPFHSRAPQQRSRAEGCPMPPASHRGRAAPLSAPPPQFHSLKTLHCGLEPHSKVFPPAARPSGCPSQQHSTPSTTLFQSRVRWIQAQPEDLAAQRVLELQV